jgi:hypothetical protein
VQRLTRFLEWFEAIANAHGINEAMQLKIAEDACVAIYDGTLKCWDCSGSPIRGGIPFEAQRRTDPWITDEAGNDWLKAKGYLWAGEYVSAPASPAPLPPSPAAIEPWKVQARQRAHQIIEDARKQGRYPNQMTIADQIAREFRAAGVHGNSDKPLTGEYIKRHALKGIDSGKAPLKSATTAQGK